MHVRVSTFEGTPEGIDASISNGRERALPACQEIDGFEGLLMLADRSSGRSLVLTFWASDEALHRSEETANSIREDSAGRTNERIATVERYELALDALTRR